MTTPEARTRIEDQEIISRTFQEGPYVCKLHIWNDNNAHIKWGKRSIFGWIDILKKTGDRIAKLGYTVTVDLNDWDLSPRYVEFGLLAKLEAFMNEKHPGSHGAKISDMVKE